MTQPRSIRCAPPTARGRRRCARPGRLWLRWIGLAIGLAISSRGANLCAAELPPAVATTPAVPTTAAAPGDRVPASAAEALARADKQCQNGLWIEAFADYGLACAFFVRQQEQASFERNALQVNRNRLHTLACLGEMAWIYRQYPAPAHMQPVALQLYTATAANPEIRRRAVRLLLDIAHDDGRIDLEKQLRSECDYLCDWQLLGPTAPETELEPPGEVVIADESINTMLAPLRLQAPSLELDRPVAVRGQRIRWRHLPEVPLDGRLPLHHLIVPAAGRRALAVTWIKSPAQLDMPLIFTVNGPLRVYHDYAITAAFPDGTGGAPVDLPLTVRLHAGWNRLLVELEAPTLPAEALGERMPGRLLAAESTAGWWLAVRLAQPLPDLVFDAIRDHAIDARVRPDERDFSRDIRPWLAPVLPAFPSMPADTRTWSDVHRDLLIAWMQAAADAAGGSRAAGTTVAAKALPYADLMKDDLRFATLLARITPAGLDGFRYPRPQDAWLDDLQREFPGQSTVHLWLAAESRRWPFRDADGAARLLTGAGAASESAAYDLRQILQAAVEAQRARPGSARKLLETIYTRAAADPQIVPVEIWYQLARLRLAAGQLAGCRDALALVPPGGAHFEALALYADLYDRWDFGRERSRVVTRARAYLAAQPLDPRGWWLLGNTLAALEQWPQAADGYRQALALNPDQPDGWSVLARAARRAGDHDLADLGQREAVRRADAPQPAWRMPPPTLTLTQLRELTQGIETAATAEPVAPVLGPTDPPAAAELAHPTRAMLRDYEYLLLLDERTDTVSSAGEVESDRSEWLYLRSRRAAKQHQRMLWPANVSGIPTRVQVRRFRPGPLPDGGAPERELEGVTLIDPAGSGGTVTSLEDLAAGDVLQIRHVARIPAARVEAAEYAAQIAFTADLPCLTRRFTLVYPSEREALWRRTGTELDFISSLDRATQTTRLTWLREWTVTEPQATANLRLNFQSQHLSALEWLRRRSNPELAAGEDVAGYVERERQMLKAQPKVSEAIARALFARVATQIQLTDAERPLMQLTAGSTRECFSRRSGNRLERCQLLAQMLRLAGFEAYVYAIRTNSQDAPDPRQQVPVLPDDFDDCLVGWHRPFDSIVWLYPHGEPRLEFGQIPARWADHPALRLNPRGPVLIEILPHQTPVDRLVGEDTP